MLPNSSLSLMGVLLCFSPTITLGTSSFLLTQLRYVFRHLLVLYHHLIYINCYPMMNPNVFLTLLRTLLRRILCHWNLRFGIVSCWTSLASSAVWLLIARNLYFNINALQHNVIMG